MIYQKGGNLVLVMMPIIFIIIGLVVYFVLNESTDASEPNVESQVNESTSSFFEETIPEMSICTDCILSRLTIINVEHNDIGGYYINVTSSGFQSTSDKIELYSK